jgi:FkbM family methyltransferase
VPALTAHEVVIDLGMWLGPFTAKAHDSGSRRIFAYEADLECYELGRENVGWYEGVKTFHKAVLAPGRPEVMPFPVGLSGFFHRTQGGYFASVETITLDAIVEMTGPVRLLKVDLEGSEWEVLYTFEGWDKVQEIVGEYHEPCAEWGKLEQRPDLPLYHHHRLKRVLQDHGYQVIVEEPKGALPCALFRAWR